MADPIRSRHPLVESIAVPLGVALVLVPLVVSAVLVLTHAPASAIRDQALMELRVRDVGTHPVLLGLYSRDGWSHPGPLLFFTLAIPYRLLGASTSGMVVGALGINAMSLAGIVAIGRRLAGRQAALVLLLTMSGLLRALGPQLIRDPWVLFVTTMPFALFACLVWALVMGRRWALPASVAAASWLVQAHVGFAPLTVPVLAGAVIWLVISTRRRPKPETPARLVPAVLGAIGVVVLAWALPVWDQLFGTGNFATTARWFRNAREGVHTIAEGVRVVVAQFGLPPDWLTGTRRVSSLNGETLLRTEWLVPILLVPFLLAIFLAWRRKESATLRLAAVTGVIGAVGIVAVARTVGTMYEYRMFWTWVFGALAATVVALTAWNEVRRRWPRTDGWITAIVLVGIAGLTVAQVVAVHGVARADWDSPSVHDVVRRLVPRLERGTGQIVLESESADGEWYLEGILLDLAKRGFDVRVRSVGGGLYPEHLVLGSGPVQQRLLVLGGSDINRLGRERAGRVIAYSGPLPLRREIAMLRAHDVRANRLLKKLAAGAITKAEYQRAAAKLTIRSRAAVAILPLPRS